MPPGFTAPAKFTCVFEPTPRCGELTPPALPETEGSPPAALPARAGALPANRAGGGGGDGSDASIIPFSAMTTRLALIRSTATKRSGGGGGGGAGAIPAVVGAHATCERDAVTWAVLLRVGDGAKASVMNASPPGVGFAPPTTTVSGLLVVFAYEAYAANAPAASCIL